MPNLMCSVTFPHDVGIPSDAAVHTWNFSGTGTALQVAQDAKQRIGNFYTVNNLTNDLQQFMATWISWTGCMFRAYNVADPEPRVAVLEENMGFSEPTTIEDWDLPSEVAACLSYGAAVASGVPAARRKGRIFIGPLNGGALNQSSVVPPRPRASFMDTIIAAAQAIIDDQGTGGAAGSTDLNWCVWSRADAMFRPAIGAYVDDAWDTQRRRGQEATDRTYTV